MIAFIATGALAGLTFGMRFGNDMHGFNFLARVVMGCAVVGAIIGAIFGLIFT